MIIVGLRKKGRDSKQITVTHVPLAASPKAFTWKLQRTSRSPVSTRRGGMLCNMFFFVFSSLKRVSLCKIIAQNPWSFAQKSLSERNPNSFSVFCLHFQKSQQPHFFPISFQFFFSRFLNCHFVPSWGSNCRVHLSIGLHKGWAIEGAAWWPRWVDGPDFGRMDLGEGGSWMPWIAILGLMMSSLISKVFF